MRKTILGLLCLSVISLKCEKNSATDSFSSSESSVGQGGSMARFTIAGNYLYSVDDRQLKTFDISNPGNPVLKNASDVGFEIETIFPFKDKLFIGSTTEVHIFSIADPAKPLKLSSAISPTVMRRCDPVVAKDSVAYATLRSNGPCGGMQSVLSVINISDIEHPFEVNTIRISEPYGLGYSNDVLYVCDKQKGLLLFDISKPFDPVPIDISIHDGEYVDVIPTWNTLICWVKDGIILYDITDNRDPLLITKIN